MKYFYLLILAAFLYSCEEEEAPSDNGPASTPNILLIIADDMGKDATAGFSEGSVKPLLLTSEATYRAFQYSEMNDGTDDLWAISNGEFKLIVSSTGTEELYNLMSDPYETNNLLSGTLTTNEESAKVELEAELLVIRD